MYSNLLNNDKLSIVQTEISLHNLVCHVSQARNKYVLPEITLVTLTHICYEGRKRKRAGVVSRAYHDQEKG